MWKLSILTSLLMSQLFTDVCCVHNNTLANLHRHLFQNYVKDVRPVLNTETTTNLSYRILVKTLLDLNTREQTFTVGTSLKAIWKDEYLTWNPDEYNGIKKFNVPATSIWLPDITMIDKYVNNGVWDLVAFRNKRIVTTYLCCPEPYPEIHYRLVFKRHAAFYIYYMVLPCLFLSVLSLLVFYLPPDCGEKLTLSITNLLALVVFQQIIAENMPPSSDDSPVIGTYFLCMIAMVCISVISTGFVMHVGGISQPMPNWMNRLFLEIAPRYLCLAIYSPRAHVGTDIEVNTTIENHQANDSAIVVNGKVDATKSGVDSDGIQPKIYNKIIDILQYVKADIDAKNNETADHLQWRRVSIIIDRMLLYLFSLFTIACTFYLGVLIIQGSTEEYHEIVNELERDWPI